MIKTYLLDSDGVDRYKEDLPWNSDSLIGDMIGEAKSTVIFLIW